MGPLPARGGGLGRGGPRPSHPSCPGAGRGSAGSPQREQEQSSARAPQARSGRGRSGSPAPSPLRTTAGRAGRWGPCAELPPPHRKARRRSLPRPGARRGRRAPQLGSWEPEVGAPTPGPGAWEPPPVGPGRHSPFHRGAPGLASGPRPSPPGAAPQPRQPSRAGGQRPGAAGSVNSPERDAQPRSRARKRLARRWEGPGAREGARGAGGGGERGAGPRSGEGRS